MNERIKELSMNAANEIADQFKPGFFDDRMVSDVGAIIEKHHKEFAEFIVKECTSKLDQLASILGKSGGTAVREGIRHVNKHFGLKE